MSLKKEFQDREYRHAYAESFANTIIATQIRLLRGAMNQKDFAQLVGMKQSRVSAMEDENYSAWSTKTLKKLAAARDVVFLGRFVSFGELLNWSRLMSEQTLTVTPFSNDPAFAETVKSPDCTSTNISQFSEIPMRMAKAALDTGAIENNESSTATKFA